MSEVLSVFENKRGVSYPINGNPQILNTLQEIKSKGIAVSLVHLGEPKEQWFESYSFYPKHSYFEFKPRYMRKEL